MSGLTVYRSTHPDALRRWHATTEAMDAWSEKMQATLITLGVDGREVWYDQVSGRIIGLGHTGGDDVPEGWRVDARTGYLVPRRSTKAGKQIAAVLDGMRRPDPRALPGMPAQVMAGVHFLTCGLEYMGGALYVRWSRPIPEKLVDSAIWERIKLSEYYAALEAHQAQEAAEAGEAQ